MAFNGLTDLLNGVNNAQNALNNNQPLNQNQQESFKADGFLVPATFQADQNGLPYTQTPNYKQSVVRRNNLVFYVPQFGTVRMYVNPESIIYTHRKLISQDKTKGGYTLQYWGEQLSTLNITGTTGSSGYEGINVLYQVYRAEQYAFDGVGLTLAANNAAADISNNIVNGVGGLLGNSINQLFGGSPNNPTAGASGAGILGGILGLSSPNNSLSAQNIPSLAQLAFSLEIYYLGQVYRGYFSDMTITESANDHLMHYQMTFVVTQLRGQRINTFPWERSAKDGPSAYTTPQSFSGNIQVGQ